MTHLHRVLDRVAFNATKLSKTNLVDTANLFCDVYGLEPTQTQAGHVHPIGDKLYFVLAGEGRIRVDADERTVRAGDLVCAPAGSEHAVMNPGPERLALLVIMAPKP